MATKEQALKWLKAGHEALVNAQFNTRVAISHARNSGASWAEIGNILGISKQAAQQRYGAYVSNTKASTTLVFQEPNE